MRRSELAPTLLINNFSSLPSYILKYNSYLNHAQHLILEHTSIVHFFAKLSNTSSINYRLHSRIQPESTVLQLHSKYPSLGTKERFFPKNHKKIHEKPRFRNRLQYKAVKKLVHSLFSLLFADFMFIFSFFHWLSFFPLFVHWFGIYL